MAENLILNYSNTVIDTPEIAYSASSSDAKTIKAVTVTNTGTSSADDGDYQAWILFDGVIPTSLVEDGEEESTPNAGPIKPYQTVFWGENDIGLGLVGQTIPASGRLYIESSSLTITFSITAE